MNNFFKYLLSLITLIISISGCSLVPGHGAATGGHGGHVAAIGSLPHRAHLWHNFYRLGNEPTGYAMYTYVLVGRDAKDSHTWDRYNKLIDSIKSSVTSTSDFSENSPEEIKKSNYNVFLIPYSTDNKLNVSLSRTILTRLLENTENDMLRHSLANSGPFLVSMIKPIGVWEEGKEFDVLYVDLTKTNIAAVDEVVKSYKNKLINTTIQKTTEYLSFRLSALSLILNADDYIQIIKVSSANLISDSP